MPLWDIHTTGPLFNPSEKQHLAQEITKIYTAAPLPAFYVRVRFTEDSPGCTFSGGVPDGEGANAGFVHLQIFHLARNFAGPEHKQRFMARVDQVLTPVMRAKGVDWEYTVNESPRDLWKINGVAPPDAGSEMEGRWVAENRVIVD